MGHRVAVVIADGVNAFELSAAGSIFGARPPSGSDWWYEFSVCSPGRNPVELANGLRLTAHEDYAWAASADTVIVPAWPTAIQTIDDEVLQFLRRLRAEDTRIVSFCSGAFLLAEAGILDDRMATTHWLHADVLQAAYPRIKVDQDRLYTEDGNVFTSAGSSSALDLSLFLVSRDHGADVAATLARRLVLAPHRPGGQNQFAQPSTREVTGVNPIARAMDWAHENLGQTIRLRDLASQAHMSERTFSRQFETTTGLSPIGWLHVQRVERAKQLLETSDLAVPRVASEVGLGSAANLRQHFGRHVGVSPSSYRESFALSRFSGSST